jgi:hypothetical protein
MANFKPNSIHSARNRAQAAYRKRLRASEVKPPILVTPTVTRALLATARLSERNALNRKKIAEVCAAILEEWAQDQHQRLKFLN